MKHSKVVQTESKSGMKRKLEIVNSNPIEPKAPLKADLIIQLRNLQDQFNALEASNKKNLETIKCLQEKIESMESERQEQSDDLDSTGGVRDCPRCDYQAEDKYDMDGHEWSEHEDDEDGIIICKICEEKFANVANLMKHKKMKHRERVENCHNYNNGGCPFEDIRCWFLHLRSNDTFKCTICDQTFLSQSNFMLHRRQHHIETVQICKNGEKCIYKKACWYKHDKLEDQKSDEINEENEKLISKLINTVKELSDKVAKLEKKDDERKQLR